MVESLCILRNSKPLVWTSFCRVTNYLYVWGLSWKFSRKATIKKRCNVSTARSDWGTWGWIRIHSDRLNFMSAITAFNLEAVKLSLHLGFRRLWKMSQRRQERYQMKLDHLPAYEGCPQKTESVFPMFLVMPSFSKASNAAAADFNPVSLVIQKSKEKEDKESLTPTGKKLFLGT